MDNTFNLTDQEVLTICGDIAQFYVRAESLPEGSVSDRLKEIMVDVSTEFKTDVDTAIAKHNFNVDSFKKRVRPLVV